MGKKKRVSSKSKKKVTLPKKKDNPQRTLVVGIIFIIIVILLIILFYSGGLIGKAYVTECDTSACFIEKANACEPAIYTTTMGTTTVEMEILPGCELKKTILALDETEPAEVRTFFTGKTMTCDYEQGNFDEDFAFQISGPLDECEGNLVDAINAVI